MKTTGKLGDVMKESIDAANSYVRSISAEIGIKPPKLIKLTSMFMFLKGPCQKMDQVLFGNGYFNRIVLTGIPVRKDLQ